MLEESEAQYGELARKLDKERMGKDSLQLEVNVLEERLDLQAKQLDRECEARLAKMHAAALDKEKALQEEHKRELEEIQQKGRAEMAALRQRQHAEVQRKTGEYETTLTELNLQLDSQRSETERLKRANVDLEADRNQIRQSLKQMLELQMKEALTLLGINKSSIDTNLQSISSFTANKSQESQVQQPIEDIDPKLAMLNYDQSIDQLISQVQLTAKQDQQLPAEQTGPKPKAAPLDQPQNANPIINYTKSIDETIDSIMREHQSIAVSTSVAGSVKTDQQTTNANSSAIKEPIKDSYILSQIELINQYYQIDGKKLAADLSQSNFMELNTANKQQGMNKSLSTSASLSSSSSNLSSSENLGAREPAEEAATNPIRSSPKTPEGQTMRPVNRVKTPLPPARLQSKRIEDEILDKSILELNANQQQHNSSTATTSTRANDLRNFIEMLLVRSPSKQSSECELQKPVETRSYSESINPSRLHVTSSSHTAREKNQPLQKQQQIGLRNYQGQHSKSQPMFPDVDLDATDLDHSNSENDTEIDNGQRGGKTKHFSYHDISDIDLGYTKRQSSEYYDDVKRTLNFDDETDQTEDETDQGTLTKTANYNTTSTPSKQRIAISGASRHAPTATNFAKKTSFSSHTNSNKQTANTSSRINGAQQVPLSCSSSKSNKIRFLKKTKSSSGNNNSQSYQSGALSSRQLANCSTISSLSNLNSTKSHSMISLVGYCSASNLQDNLNRNSKNVKQRAWK